MDPDANLAEQRQTSKDILELVDSEGFEEDDDAKEQVIEKAARLAELCGALDEWVMKSGALPKQWHEKQTANLNQ